MRTKLATDVGQWRSRSSGIWTSCGRGWSGGWGAAVGEIERPDAGVVVRDADRGARAGGAVAAGGGRDLPGLRPGAAGGGAGRGRGGRRAGGGADPLRARRRLPRRAVRRHAVRRRADPRASSPPADPWLSGLPDDAARRAVWESFLDTLGGDPPRRRRRARVARRAHRRARVVGPLPGLGHRRLAAAGAGRGAWRGAGPTGPATSHRRRCCGATSGYGNVVFDPDRLAPRAVLDWDMASVGPAEMDVAWFLALDQLAAELSGMTVSGFGAREEAVAVDRAPPRPRLQDLDWYEVFALGPVRARCRPASPSCSSEPVSARCSSRARTRPSAALASPRLAPPSRARR